MKKRIITLLFIFLSLSLYAQKHNAELTYHEAYISIKNGKMYRKMLYKIKIYNRAGEKYTKVHVPYSGIQKIKKLEASITELNGKTIKKLKKNDIVDKSAISDISLYEDNYVKEFTLKHNSYPYFLNYSFEEEIDEFLHIANWQPVIDIEIPTMAAKLIIEYPIDYEIYKREQFIDDYKTETFGNIKRHTWISSYKKVLEKEQFAPSVYNYTPKVLIVPKNFIYNEEGSFSNWIEYGNWECDLNKGLNDLPDKEKAVLAEHIKNIEKDKERIKRLFHYLQDKTRYINVSIGVGGMKPYPASYVAKNKYGDCKALSNYFKSILEYFSIKSYLVNIYAGDKIKCIDESFPAQQFNHVILCVPVTKDTLWVDCTSGLAFNYLGTFTQNRKALLVKKDASTIIQTPSMSIDEVLESRMIKITPGENNIALAKFNSTYRGDKYELFHHVYNNYNEAQKDRIIRNYLVDNGFELQEYEIKPEDRDSAKIEFNYSAKSDKIYMKYGNELVIKAIPISLTKLEPVDERKLPVQIDYPVYKIDTMEFQLPIGYKSMNNLEGTVIENEFGFYKTKFENESDKVRLIRQFMLKSGVYQLDKYPLFFDFIEAVDQAENKNNFLIIKD
jgi:hypothetical protein